MATTDFPSQLDDGTRSVLLARATRRHLHKGEFVFRIGDPDDTVFMLLSGRIKTYKISPNGREVILWFGFPGEVFGFAEIS